MWGLMAELQTVLAFPVAFSLFGLHSHLYVLVCPRPLNPCFNSFVNIWRQAEYNLQVLLAGVEGLILSLD